MGSSSSSQHSDIFEGDIAVGVDAGSVHTRCVLAEVRRSGLVYLGRAVVPSRGWLRGEVVDPVAASESVREAIDEARGLIPVEKVTFGIGGGGVTTLCENSILWMCRNAEGKYLRVIENLGRLRVGDELVVLELSITGLRFIDNSPGLFEAGGPTIVTTEASLSALCRMRGEIGTEWVEFEASAAGKGALSEAEMGTGAVVLDVGAESSGIAIWNNKHVVLAEGVALGGNHIVRNVAFDLGISEDEARRLQKGMVASSGEKFNLDAEERFDSNTWEFADYVVGEFLARGMKLSAQFPNQVVLTGDYWNIHRLVLPFTVRLGRKVRLGSPHGIHGFPDDEMFERTGWCVAVGLTKTSGKYKEAARSIDEKGMRMVEEIFTKVSKGAS